MPNSSLPPQLSKEGHAPFHCRRIHLASLGKQADGQCNQSGRLRFSGECCNASSWVGTAYQIGIHSLAEKRWGRKIQDFFSSRR